MKRQIHKTILFLSLLLFIVSCTKKGKETKSNKFVLTGKFINDYNDSIFFQYGAVKDCTVVKNNIFRFEGDYDSPDKVQGYLQLRNAANPNIVFLDTGKIDVTLERNSKVIENKTYNDVYVRSVKGSANHDLWDNWGRFYKQINAKDNATKTRLIVEKLKNTVDSFPASPINGKMLYLYSQDGLDLNDVLELKKVIDTTTMIPNDLVNLNTNIKSKVRTQKGTVLKNFVLENQSGKLENYYTPNGKITLIDFWATWCGPCLEQTEELRKLAKTYKDKLEIVGISLDDADDKEKWKKTISKYSLSWKNYIVKGGWDSEISAYYGITAIPSNIVVDKNGKIIAANVSMAALDSLLKNK